MSSSTEPASINEALLDDSLYVNSCLYQHMIVSFITRTVPHRSVSIQRGIEEGKNVNLGLCGVSTIIAIAPAKSIVSAASICVSVCLYFNVITEKSLNKYQLNLLGMCVLVCSRSD